MAIDGAAGELAIGGLPFHHHRRAFKPMQVDFAGRGLNGKRLWLASAAEDATAGEQAAVAPRRIPRYTFTPDYAGKPARIHHDYCESVRFNLIPPLLVVM